MINKNTLIQHIQLLCLIPVIFIYGCNQQRATPSHNVNDSLCQVKEESTQESSVYSNLTTVYQIDSIASQNDSMEKGPINLDEFVKIEVNEKEGYEVRRVNELTFTKDFICDSLRSVLRRLSPTEDETSLSISIYSSNRMVLINSRRPRSIIKGEEEYAYHFGYVQIDSFYIDVKGFNDIVNVKEAASKWFRRTGEKHDYKYIYYEPTLDGENEYLLVLSDSTMLTFMKYESW